VVLPHVVVMGFDEAGRVAYEHIYWDQATLLVQVKLLDADCFLSQLPKRPSDRRILPTK
jgi:hypothetical protein